MIANWEDARKIAARKLPKIFFDYIDGAAFSEQTNRANVEDFDAWKLNQRVLVDVSKRDLSTEYLGGAAVAVSARPGGFLRPICATRRDFRPREQRMLQAYRFVCRTSA